MQEITQEMTRWIDRRFEYVPPVGEFPMIVERLRGTPARVADRVRFLSGNVLGGRRSEAWSIQEHVGHLLDLESLWSVRVDEFLRGAKELTAADMTNRRTRDADHNAHALAAIIAEFTVSRQRLVDRLDRAPDPSCTSFHPRLKRPMRLIDLCFFIAEHDDHHLTIVTRMLAGGNIPG